MSLVVSRIDHVPIFPDDLLGWKEFLTYAASICLSYFSGVFIRRGIANVQDKNSPAGFVTEMISRLLAEQMGGTDQVPAKDKIEANIRALKAIRTVSVATASAACSCLQRYLAEPATAEVPRMRVLVAIATKALGS